jgi:hypothetical protein
MSDCVHYMLRMDTAMKICTFSSLTSLRSCHWTWDHMKKNVSYAKRSRCEGRKLKSFEIQSKWTRESSEKKIVCGTGL